MSPFFRTRPRLLWQGGAVLGSVVVVAMVTGPTAYAASNAAGDGVDAVNTETVQVYMNSNAEPTSKRVYEQLALTGNGKVDLRNPIATKGLRNLAGFGGIKVKNGEQIIDTTVDGTKKYRSVSDYTGSLPLDVDVDYTLDGKKVEPGDVVGKSGKLKVLYTVTNRTGKDEKVSYKDAEGKTRTTTEEVVIPMVGSLTTTTPGSFTNVKSGEANIAGDGKGGTKLSFTMTLFPPIGAPQTSFGYTATIKNGVVPRVDVSALPVNPLESPTFSKAAASYQGGADTGIQLTDGAVQIDSNLLKLRDGAKDLLQGLVKLRKGSSDLSEGLNGEAGPGAKKLDAGASALNVGLNKLRNGSGQLRDGTGTLRDGTGQVNDGANQLEGGTGTLVDGTGRLSVGTAKALAGGKSLSGGLEQISGGLSQLQAQLSSQDSQAGIQQIRDGIVALSAGVGDPNAGPNSTTLIGGLKSLNNAAAGLPAATAGATKIREGAEALANNSTGLPAAKSGLDGAKTQLDTSLNTTNPQSPSDFDRLVGGATALQNNAACAADATCKGTADAVKNGLVTAKGNLAQLSTGLGQISSGLGGAIAKITSSDPANPGLVLGATRLEGGLTQASAGSAKLENSASTLIAPGLQKLLAGYDQLIGKLAEATTGIGKLNTGAASAYTGSNDLAAGLGTLDTGADQLDAGAVRLNDGVIKLADGTLKLDNGAIKLNSGAIKLADGTVVASDGSKKLANGATQLSSGLVAAASGSTKITDGLKKAAKGTTKLPAGANKLSKQGTQKLIGAGQDTTKTYAQNVAIIGASAKRADKDSMAYGAPKDAAGLTAYSYIIEGDDGEGGRNLVRTLGGAGVLAAGGGVLFLRRRFLV